MNQRDKIFEVLEDNLRERSLEGYEKCFRQVIVDTGVDIYTDTGPYRIVAFPPDYEELFDDLIELSTEYTADIITDIVKKVFNK